MPEVEVTFTGNTAPFMSALEKVKESAKETGEKVSESIGVEGLKGEGRLHAKFLGAFKDITAGGKSSAEAIGGAFENLSEGLRLSMGSMVALLAISELVKSVYEGNEAFNKMHEAGENALSINKDVTSKSIDMTTDSAKEMHEEVEKPVEIGVKGEAAQSAIEKTRETVKDVKEELEMPSQVQLDAFVSDSSVEKVKDTIKKLQDDAAANNITTNSSLIAGAEVLVQSLREWKSVSSVVREDAVKAFELNKEAHDLEDAASAKTINDANTVLQMKLDGHDKEAEAFEKEAEMQEKLHAAQEKHDQQTIDALNTQIELTQKLTETEEYKKSDDKFKGIVKEEDAEKAKQDEAGKTDIQKLADAKSKTQQDQDKVDNYGDSLNQEGANAKEALRLQLLKDQTKEKELQATVDKSNTELVKSLAEEERKSREAGQTEGQKLKDSKDTVKDDQRNIDEATDDGTAENTQNLLKLKLQLEKDITAEREQQQRYDAEQVRKLDLLKEQKEAQQAVQATALDATLFHGVASSLAKTGLGGRVSGPNFGNQSQLKAAQDAVKHLADLNKKLDAFGKSIGVAGG